MDIKTKVYSKEGKKASFMVEEKTNPNNVWYENGWITGRTAKKIQQHLLDTGWKLSYETLADHNGGGLF